MPFLKPPPFKLSSADREIWLPGSEDFSLWCQYYLGGWKPLPYQVYFHEAPQKQKILVAGIRTGKTMGVAAGFCHYLMYHPNARIANASISADQATIVYHAMLDFCNRKNLARWVEHTERHPYPLIRFVNGAEAWFRSVGYEGELWRGHEFDWINLDEGSYVSSTVAITTLEGRLLGSYQVYGEQVERDRLFTITTSPRGKTWLFERWKLGDPKFYGARPDKYLSMRARTRDNVHLSREAIEDLESRMTPRQIQQELDGLFVDSEGAQFAYEDIMRTCTTSQWTEAGEIVEAHPEVDELVREVERYLADHASRARREDLDYYFLEPQADHIYVQSWDVGKKPNKLGRNASVGGVLDISRKPWKLVAYRYAPGVNYTSTLEYIKEWHRFYSQGSCTCETVIDATGTQDILNESLEVVDRIRVEGFNYTSSSKPQVVHSLAMTLEKGWLVMPFIRRMVDQLQGYELPDDKIPQDLVMMLGQACLVGRRHYGDLGLDRTRDANVFGSHRRADRSNAEAAQAVLDNYRARREASRGQRSGRSGGRSGRDRWEAILRSRLGD